MININNVHHRKDINDVKNCISTSQDTEDHPFESGQFFDNFENDFLNEIENLVPLDSNENFQYLTSSESGDEEHYLHSSSIPHQYAHKRTFIENNNVITMHEMCDAQNIGIKAGTLNLHNKVSLHDTQASIPDVQASNLNYVSGVTATSIIGSNENYNNESHSSKVHDESCEQDEPLEIGAQDIHPIQERQMLKSSQSFIIGALSGSCQQMISHPLEYIKTVKQYNNVQYSDIIRSIIKKPTSAWTGALITCVCYSPRTAVRFAAFEFINDRIENPFLSGAFSGIFEAMTVATIAETIKTKVMVSKEPVWASLKREGFFAIYKGVIPTLGKQIVNHSVRFGGTETFTSWMSGGSKEDRKWWHVTLGAGMSGMISAIVTQPFDVVKSLQQSGDPRYKSVLMCLQSLQNSDGGLLKHAYRGLGARLARVMLEVSLTFTFYNTIKDAVEHYLTSEDNDRL